MFCNVFNVIQWGSCVPEHNNVKRTKSNATTMKHVFIISCWFVSTIIMEIDMKP